jgi:hypothetical protein
MTYYGLPLLKRPVWTWEVPAYFFVGGAAGATAVLGFAARVRGEDGRLIRDARWIAAIGASLSAPLLIADLGRPERFLNMLRVFKPQSPMSVGAWLLAGFGAASVATVVLRGRKSDVASAASAFFGLGMSTYTGVLIGATAIPVWARHVTALPMHFAASALGSAVSLLEIRGHRQKALNRLGIAAAVFELFSERERQKGELGRLAETLAGSVPLVLRFAGRRNAASMATLLGSFLSRLAWLNAGKSSADDPRAALDSGRDAVRSGETVGERQPRRKPGQQKTSPTEKQ